MRYASIRKMDTSNGNGVHTSIFVQGCYHRCKGCWNESTWDFNGGKELTEELLNKFIDLVCWQGSGVCEHSLEPQPSLGADTWWPRNSQISTPA